MSNAKRCILKGIWAISGPGIVVGGIAGVGVVLRIVGDVISIVADNMLGLVRLLFV